MTVEAFGPETRPRTSYPLGTFLSLASGTLRSECKKNAGASDR